jgi:hypothetical protein
MGVRRCVYEYVYRRAKVGDNSVINSVAALRTQPADITYPVVCMCVRVYVCVCVCVCVSFDLRAKLGEHTTHPECVWVWVRVYILFDLRAKLGVNTSFPA